MEACIDFTHVLNIAKNICILINEMTKMAKRFVSGHSAATKIINKQFHTQWTKLLWTGNASQECWLMLEQLLLLAACETIASFGKTDVSERYTQWSKWAGMHLNGILALVYNGRWHTA
jgi:hypothetical protein